MSTSESSPHPTGSPSPESVGGRQAGGPGGGGGHRGGGGHGGGVERFGYRQELRRSLSFTDLLVYGLVFMVPIAPFGIFGSVYAASGGMVALAYVIGGVAMTFTALSYAQMSRAFPVAGSVYSYAGRGLHPVAGFLGGWLILLDYILVPALLYIVAGVAMHSFIAAVPVWAWVAGFVVLNTAINYAGIALTARVNKIVLVAELIVLAIFLVIGIAALASGEGNGQGIEPLFNSETFATGTVLTAVSVAVLSFLGFDAISTLSEENKGNERTIGRATLAALALAGVLFVVQTWVASLFVSDPDRLISEGDAAGTAFYDAAAVAGGPWLAVLTAVSTAIAWGFADALVAQAATSRLLFSMARDRQLPRVLSRVHARHKVPVNATLLVAGISLALGVWFAHRDDGIPLLSTLINFGALSAFLLLHASVVHHFVRRRAGGRVDVWRHVVAPIVGFVVILFTIIKANVAAQKLGFTWLAIGVGIVVVSYAIGRRPRISGMEGDADEPAAT
jgi:amino acid transporter